jgi:hypothetical protein
MLGAVARALLVVNPFASRVTDAAVARVAEALGDVVVVRTERPGHATELVRAAAGDVEAIYVFSGDGGFNEALNGLVGDVPLGFIPGGGTNVLPRALGLPRVPDAYVVLGNGQINAFASGHGFRRYVAVNSDLFEVGGRLTDPEALRFVIGHEVGHIAAGHASYWRQSGISIANLIPGLGSTLSRAQEYTADNHAYEFCPEGVKGLRVLAAGKYLYPHVDFGDIAARANTDQGLFVMLANFLSSHPVNTWRFAALADRSRPGRVL